MMLRIMKLNYKTSSVASSCTTVIFFIRSTLRTEYRRKNKVKPHRIIP